MKFSNHVNRQFHSHVKDNILWRRLFFLSEQDLNHWKVRVPCPDDDAFKG